ncbi:DUF1963 domain-containing protein [Deinococcus radiomollis]|uniref:DUF1963 domain-containing protein n=1 Tax=Deinococcus radiomollis TaxID=468916 RepID=UPI0038914A69
MPPIYLEFSEGNEHKFYEISTDGPRLILRYGRIGTAGQSQTKIFEDTAAAEAEAQKKLTEKRRKGYLEAVPGHTGARAVMPARLKLPAGLKPHREKIEVTLRPVVSLTLSEEPVSAWSSKVGGVPYREQGEVWPRDPADSPLSFLAQLNLSELPALEGVPTTGLLRFFIGADVLMGCRFEADRQPQDTYRVLYTERPITDDSRLDSSVSVWPSEVEQISPLESSHSLKITGTLTEMPMTVSDRLFGDTIGIDFLDDADSPDDGLQLGEYLEEQYREASEVGHQLGGYPTFTQFDPRTREQPHVLLFQLCSDALGVMWGDAGIGNFFIHPDELARRDFSRVFYNWDCS